MSDAKTQQVNLSGEAVEDPDVSEDTELKKYRILMASRYFIKLTEESWERLLTAKKGESAAEHQQRVKNWVQGHARVIFDERVNDVLAVLSKYGGWQFGDLELNGKLEYGCSEEKVIEAFQSATREPPADSELRFDHSVTAGEGETDDPQTAFDVFDYAKATKELRANTAELKNSIGQLKDLDTKTDLLVNITSKLEVTVERLAGVEAFLIEHEARESVARVEQIAKDQGVMYQ